MCCIDGPALRAENLEISREEVADLAVFLSSDKARHITGQAIGVDGNLEREE